LRKGERSRRAWKRTRTSAVFIAGYVALSWFHRASVSSMTHSAF
jgi:hypothetical protein